MAKAFRLEVAEYTDADHWRWALKDSAGAFLAGQKVELDRADQNYWSLIDLPGYIRHCATPLNRDADERRLIAEVGNWVSQHLLGKDITKELRARQNLSGGTCYCAAGGGTAVGPAAGDCAFGQPLAFG